MDRNKKHEISEFPLPCLIPGGNHVWTPQLFAKVPGTVRPNPCIGRCPWRRRASLSTPQFLDKGWGSGGWWMKCSWIVAVACLISCVDIHDIWYSGLVYTIVTLMIMVSDEFLGAAHFSGTLMNGTSPANHWHGHHLIQGPPKRICISGSKLMITRVYQGQVVNGEDPWNRALNNQGRAALTNWDAHPSTLLETNMTVNSRLYTFRNTQKKLLNFYI